MLSVHTLAASPYGVLFASATASLGVRNVIAHEHRPEDLDLRDRRRRLHVGEQRRRIEAALRRTRPRRLPHRRAFVDALLHERADALELHRRDDRAHVHRLVERRAEAQLLHPRAQLRDEPLGDSFLHEQARARAAHLALIEPDRVDDAFDDAVEIRVVEDDERALPAELERQLLARSRRRLADDAADLGRAGERDLVDVRDDRRSPRRCSPSPVTMLSTPGGSPDSCASSANASAVSGVNSAGLSTIVFPAASAGAIFHASISSGKFHGMICPTTPTAS